MNKFFKQIKATFQEQVDEMVNGKKIGFILISAIMMIVMTYVVKNMIFDTYHHTKSSFFCIVSACIWVGIFNSIQKICSVRSRIKIQNLQGMSVTAYMVGQVSFQMVICLIQSVVITLIFICTLVVPRNSLLVDFIIDYYIMFFMIIFASDMMGIMVSCISKNNTVAMTIMPFILVIQMVLSNVLIKLDGFIAKVSYLTVSYWGINGMGALCDIKSLSGSSVDVQSLPDGFFEATSEHFLNVIFALLIFSLVFIILGIIRLSGIRKENLF